LAGDGGEKRRAPEHLFFYNSIFFQHLELAATDVHPCFDRCVDMYEWAAHAAYSEAVVLSTLHSGMGESGDVQSMLDYMGVVYTGSGVFPTHTCSDKVSIFCNLIPDVFSPLPDTCLL